MPQGLAVMELSKLSLIGATIPATPSFVVSSAYSTGKNGGRKIVRLSNGWIILAVANTSSTYYVYFYVSKDNGKTWSQIASYSTGTVNPSGQFAITSSGTTVYYLIANGNAPMAGSFDATTTTGTLTPTNVDSASNSLSGASLTIDGTGALHAAFCSKNNTYANSFNVRYSKSTDGGTTWAAPTQVTGYNTSGYDAKNPCIVVDSTNRPIIFCQVYTTQYYIYGLSTSGMANAAAGTLLWRNTLVYNGATYVQENVDVALDGSDALYATWDGLDATYPNHYNIRYSKSTDGGTTWSAMALLTTGNSYDQTDSSITIESNGDLCILFDGVDPAISTGVVNIRKITYSGGVWSAITTLTNNTKAHARFPQTLWSKFNMNSDDAVRYIWEDDQNLFVQYDQTPRFNVPAPQPIVEARIPLWWSDGGGTGTNLNNTSAGVYFLGDATNQTVSASATNAKLFTLSANWSSSVEYALEVSLESAGSSYTTYAELWDFTTNAAVTASQVSTTSSVYTLVRSGQFTLTPGHTYGITYWASNGTTTSDIADASLIVFP